VCPLVRCWVLGVIVVALVGACGDDADDGTPTTAPATTAPATVVGAAEATCREAADSLGTAETPADLEGVAAGAEAIAALAGNAQATAAVPALAGVAAGARLVADAARSGDNAAVTDAAATLTDAYDALDLAAADLRLAVCTSESWGRQVVIAAVDLTGAGG
jgi:hypothetical protein